MALLLIRIEAHFSQNLAAVEVIKHLRPIIARCTPLDAEWAWDGTNLPANSSAYLQAMMMSFGAPGTLEETAYPEHRDPRLGDWARALQLARRGYAEESMLYFKTAGTGYIFLAAGHKTYLTDPACTVFNWVLAHEIGNVGPYPDPPLPNIINYVESLIANGQAQAVIDAYTRLLNFEPHKTEWRLTLDKALLILKQATH
jgi:hypothetical protein